MNYVLVEKKQKFDFWGYEDKGVYVDDVSFEKVKEKFISDGLILKQDYYNSGPDVVERINIINDKYNYLIQEELTGVDKSNTDYAKIVSKDLFLINDEGVIIKGIRLVANTKSEMITLEEIAIDNADNIIKNIDYSSIDNRIKDYEEKILNYQERLTNLRNINSSIKILKFS